LNILAQLVDYYAQINNPQNKNDIELVKPEGSTWEAFRQQWIQTVAYIDDKRKVLKKIDYQEKNYLHSNR